MWECFSSFSEFTGIKPEVNLIANINLTISVKGGQNVVKEWTNVLLTLYD